jgi:hypothetical protein
MWRAAARLSTGVALAIAIAFLIVACGSETRSAPAAPTAALAANAAIGPRTLSVNVAVKNRLNNAVETDVTLRITVGTVTVRFKGSKTPWVMQSVLANTPFTVEASSRPDDYVTNTCSGTVGGADVNCTITLTDTLAAPGCDAALMKFLYRPKRFEGLQSDGTPIPRCETTWGIVRGTGSEHDGDVESLIHPIKSESSRLLSAAHGNFNAGRNGYVVGEWICRAEVSAIGRSQGCTTQCEEYKQYVAAGRFQELPLPEVGDSAVFVGFLVHDCGHGCWTELHPLVWWHKLLHPLTPDLF